MKNILHKIKQHSYIIANHVRFHKNHYVMWWFASFAVIKSIFLLAGAIWWLSIIQTNANFTDPITSCAQITEIPNNECQALLELYTTTQGEHRTHTDNWWDMTNISRRYGVNVDNGHVTKIMLWKNNLVGDISTKIGNLTYLERLDVYNNHITSLPTEIQELAHLKYLYIYNNELTSLPPEIVRLINLEWLYINGNKLTQLPLELGHFTKLLWFDVSNNKLTSLPAELEYLNNLEYLNIKNNDIHTTSLTPSMNKFILSKIWQDRQKTQCSTQRDCTSVYYNNICGPCSDILEQSQLNIHNSAEDIQEDIQEDIAHIHSPELYSAHQWAYKIGITTISNIQKANMEGNITRSELAKMISVFAIKVLKKQPDYQNNCVFDDSIEESEEVQFYITTSCQLGLMGMYMTDFEPNTQVTRAQVTTVLSRALYGTLHDQWEPYYTNHLHALKIADIISDTNPDIQELRSSVLLMLYRTQ